MYPTPRCRHQINLYRFANTKLFSLNVNEIHEFIQNSISSSMITNLDFLQIPKYLNIQRSIIISRLFAAENVFHKNNEC